MFSNGSLTSHVLQWTQLEKFTLSVLFPVDSSTRHLVDAGRAEPHAGVLVLLGAFAVADAEILDLQVATAALSSCVAPE